MAVEAKVKWGALGTLALAAGTVWLLHSPNEGIPPAQTHPAAPVTPTPPEQSVDQKPTVLATYLTLLRQALQTLEQTGKQVPGETVVVADYRMPIADVDVLHLGINAHPFVSLGWYYLRQEPALLDGYRKAVDEAIFKNAASIRNTRLTEVDSFLAPFIMDWDNFAWTFSKYLDNGTWFRRRILYLQATGYQGEASVLQARYDFMGSFLGADFSIKAIPKELRRYLVNSIIKVEDDEESYDPKTFGVLLRPSSSSDKDPSWPYVRNRDLVRVLKEPILVVDEKREEAYWVYQVEAGFIEPDKDGQEFWIPDVRRKGYMPGDYLGAAIATFTPPS
ncbi:hypothetical protein HY387_01115 [Candidatus Daviesbacteria bacterium]|nr:hypothetical protein [Candidatus Daviesbacteria bacterium]